MESPRLRWPRRRFLTAVALLFGIVILAPPVPALGQDATPRAAGSVILATTTSTADTGLLDALAPLFKERTGYTLKPIAVGSGAALELGKKGEADVVLSHSPAAEEEFMAEGYGTERRTVMYNDFVIVGPAADSANVAAADSAIDAMTRIAMSQSTFASRGDDSGTNALELKLWKAAGIEPQGSWYVESGTGMGDALNIASERGGYTISDRGTYLALRNHLALDVLYQGDPALINIYHVILVNPKNGHDVDTAAGKAFLDFLLDPETQKFVGNFAVAEYGQPLFTPCADNSCGVEKAATPVATPA
jgi:tungstate transport system substrate-binding protein